MLWRDPINNKIDCYSCLTHPATLRQRSTLYPDVQSVTKPVPHSDSLPTLKLVVTGPSSGMKLQRTLENESQSGGESEAGKPHLLIQELSIHTLKQQSRTIEYDHQNFFFSSATWIFYVRINLGTESDEQNERFHQDMTKFEDR